MNKLIEKTHRCHNDPSKVIHNFSSYELNDIEKSLLVRGLNFSICPGKLNYADYCINFEYLFKAIKTDGILSPHKLDFVKTRLKDIALSSYKEHNSFPYKYSNLSKEEAECLKKLSENKNLVIQKSDKGNAIVILNREDYVGKVKELLSDSSKFKVANVKEGKEIRHLMNVREDFKQVIDELLRMEKITQQTYWKLDPIGCKPGVLYGLSKVHKTLVNGLPKMRPILSAIGTAGYNVSKFLLPILDSVANGPYTIINTFSFNKEVQLQDANLVMGSLDVDALFTNIPLDETINICVTELFKDKELINKLNKDDVRDLLQLASKNTLFIFDGILYQQIDGVAMGSPLGPHFANTFMNYHEKQWLKDCPLDFKPKYYRRYVDDIFVLCESIEHLEKFREYLNVKHPNINFTSEIEVDKKLPFLDTLVDRSSGMFITSVYRKPTFTGVYTHFLSFLPSVYKFGLLSTLLFRYFSICSNFQLFHLEVVEFKKIFTKNGYPSKLIDACIFKFLNKMYVKKVNIDTVPKREYLIVLPYLGPLSTKIQHRIKTVFQKTLNYGKIRIVFRTTRRLSHLLRFKDLVSTDLSSHIIYHFKCSCCNAGYIGETRKHFKVRSSQHLGISEFTGRPMKGGLPTAITKHIKDSKCQCDLRNFDILGREEDYHKRLVKESLFIKLYDYALNEQQTSTELLLF